MGCEPTFSQQCKQDHESNPLTTAPRCLLIGKKNVPLQEPEQEEIEAVEAVVSETAPVQYRTTEASEVAPIQYRTTDLDAESSEDEQVPKLGKGMNHERILLFRRGRGWTHRKRQ